MMVEKAKETLENFKLVDKFFMQAKCLILCFSKNANRAVPWSLSKLYFEISTLNFNWKLSKCLLYNCLLSVGPKANDTSILLFLIDIVNIEVTKLGIKKETVNYFRMLIKKVFCIIGNINSTNNITIFRIFNKFFF